MTEPVFGLKFIQVNDQAEPVIGANLDVVGLIGPCSTADPDLFPLDTPVYFASNDASFLKKLGTDGYIADALEGINDQLADFQVAAQIVYVRTDYGSAGNVNLKLQQTIAKIMGSSVAQTGLWAFLKAPNSLYVTPRLLLAPGYTGQQATSLDTLHVGTVGTGYNPGSVYQVTFAQGGGETNGAQLVLPVAHAIARADGSIHDSDVFIDSFGAWMTVAPTATLPASDGPPITALPATGSIVFTANPNVGSTITLNGSIVSFVSGAPTGLQVQISPSNLTGTLANLLAFLNSTADAQVSKNTYSVSSGTVNIVNDTPGVAGNGYTLGTTVGFASLSGATLSGGRDAASSATATLTATVALGANPVCAMMGGGVLDGLIGHGVVESTGTSLISDENWRDTLNSQRLIGCSGGVKVQDPTSGDIVIKPFAPRVAGAIIAKDFQTGYPFHSAANTPIKGIVGPARSIAFSLTDGATEGQQLLGANMGILVRGLIGVETAISSGGFIYVGTDNCSDDPLWQFYNVTRGRDYINLSLMPALRTYLGRTNIDRQTVMNVVTTINDFLNQLTALQQILGGHANFRGNLNSASEIRLGHLTVGYVAEEPPVLRKITTMAGRDRPAIDAMVAQLQQQLNIAA